MFEYGRYDEIFGKWRGATVSFHMAYGNVGDRLIDLATLQLFEHFDIAVAGEGDDFDAVFWASGGNMGTFYPASFGLRTKAAALARATGKPFIILPQSWITPDPGEFTEAYVRELYSLKYCPGAIVAPDLALAYRPDFAIPPLDAAIRDEGFYFRNDKEQVLRTGVSLGDPATMAKTPREYILLASQSRHIHTNRLHFAVSALIAGRAVTLYSNSYHKNIGVWELWLRDLGCGFREK